MSEKRLLSTVNFILFSKKVHSMIDCISSNKVLRELMAKDMGPCILLFAAQLSDNSISMLMLLDEEIAIDFVVGMQNMMAPGRICAVDRFT